MAVNISAMEFRDENFLGGVLSALENAGLDPGCLELELTRKRSDEACRGHGIHSSTDEAAEGVHLAVDDFGTELLKLELS